MEQVQLKAQNCSERASIFSISFSASMRQIVSICPVLGEQYAQLRNGTCPRHLQHPIGKSLPISFIGTYPFITYNPIGGRDLKVIATLAKKFRFLPKFIPMTTFGSGADSLGMTHHVSNKKFDTYFNFLCKKLNRLLQNNQN